ncbi:MAG: helix-turn-helix transcriptional regulator [Firmicutes bacterium]|nr:helix-turn-helix transcriptional regulator [Bacillota bacterium]
MKNRIRALRTEKNITQLRLSMELEVAQETISAYEKGKHAPSLKSLIKLADLFDVSIDYLVGRSDVRKMERRDVLSEDEALLLSRFRSLNTIDKARMLAYSQGMSEKSPSDHESV